MELKTIKLESKMLSHMSLDTMHISQTEYLIKGNCLLNDRIFIGESYTKKSRGIYGKFGKSTSLYYFRDTVKGKEFKSIEKLLKSVNLKLATR